VIGRKKTGKKEWLTREMLTLEKKGLGRENQAELFRLGHMNTACR